MRGVEVEGEGRRAFIILLCSYPFLANRVFASWYRDKCLYSLHIVIHDTLINYGTGCNTL